MRRRTMRVSAAAIAICIVAGGSAQAAGEPEPAPYPETDVAPDVLSDDLSMLTQGGENASVSTPTAATPPCNFFTRADRVHRSSTEKCAASLTSTSSTTPIALRSSLRFPATSSAAHRSSAAAPQCGRPIEHA